MTCISDDCGGSPLVYNLSIIEANGLTVTAVANVLSLVALFYVFIIVVRNVVWRIRHIPDDWSEKLRVFHQPMDLLITSLFIADALQASGGVINLSWVHDRRVEVGGLCNAQGTLKIFGASGVALSTLVIAVYTFFGSWAGIPVKSKTATLVVLVVLWSFIAVLVIVGVTTNTNFFAPAPFWCWIHDELVWKLFCEYFWIWVALAISLIAYTLLFLWMRGNVVVDGRKWWRVTLQSADNLDPDEMANRRHSIIMAAYPTVYAICVLPLSVVRWIGFVQKHKYGTTTVSPEATFAVSTIFNLSGLFNVILLLTTRPESGLFGKLMFQSSGVPSESESEQTSTPATHTTPGPDTTPATHAVPGPDSDGHLPF